MTGSKNSEVDFSWMRYMEADGSLAAYDQSLFPQLRCSERRLSELILRPGRKVIVRRTEKLEPAKVEIVFESKLYVTLSSGFECIELDDVVPDNVLRINGNRGASDSEDASSSDINSSEELTAAELDLAHLTMAEAVKVGQYFELQDRINPCKVHIAQVFENRGGILLVGKNGAPPDADRPLRIFMTDEKCHAIGWMESGAQTKLFYADGAGAVLKAAKANPVTHWVFEHFRVREHKFQENMSLEVLQAAEGGVFYAGHVTEVINSHYFTVKIAESLAGMEKTITCSKSHPQIFPSGWCQRHGLRLTPPSDYIGEEEFSMLVYEAKLNLKGKAPESLFDPPKTLYKPERLRNVEILDIRTKNEMFPAKILRWMKHIVWVSYSHFTNATPPGVLSTRCGLIFPCGFAQQHGISLREPAITSGLGDIPPNGDRFGLREKCTTHRTSVFVKPEKRFLPAVYLDNDLMLPQVYLKKSCFCGPFLDPARVRALPDKYPSGPMPAVIRLILADIINAAYRPEDLSKLMSCSKDTSAPIIFAKARVYGKPYRFRVECCEKVTEFCGWLRNICLLLDCCPELFSLSAESCDSYCVALKENPYMWPEKHAWSVNYQTMTTPTRRIRVESGNSASRPNLPTRRKKKIEKPSLPEIRRPVTRAVLRKTIRSPKSEETKSASQSPAKKEKNPAAEPKLDLKVVDAAKAVKAVDTQRPISKQYQSAKAQLAGAVKPALKRTPPSASEEVQAQVVQLKKIKRSPVTSEIATPINEEKVAIRRRRNLPSSHESSAIAESSSDLRSLRIPEKKMVVKPLAGMNRPQVATNKFTTVPNEQQVATSSSQEIGSPAQIHANNRPSSNLQEIVVLPSSCKPNLPPGKRSSGIREENSDSVRMPPVLTNPFTWSCSQLSEWLKQTDVALFADLLKKDEVDGEAFLLLSLDECISHLKIKLGPAMKIESLRKGLHNYWEKYFHGSRK